MPLNILQYITPSRLAGAEYFFLNIVEHLARKGHCVHVVTKRDTPLRPEIEKLLPLGVRLHAWHTHGKVDPRTLAKLCRLIRREKIDVINTHLTTASWQGAIAGRITGVPSVAVVHATDRKLWFQHADRLIAVSGGVRDSLVAQGIAPAKIATLYHGIDLDRYSSPLPVSEAKARLGLAPNTKTVGVAASLIERKGHRFLLEAWPSIEKQVGGPVHAIFAGEGPLEADLRARVGRLGLENRVHFLGFRRDMADVLCAMDAFCLPSLKEGLSIAVMEAMALERPVVVSRIAGLPEVVIDGKTGLLAEPGDVESLGAQLSRVLLDPDLGKRLGCEGRAFLEENFEQTACLNAMESYFLDVACELPRSEVSRALRSGMAPEEAASKRAPLRIVQIIAPSKIAGAERSTVDLCRGLERLGHNVELLVKNNHPLLEVAQDAGVQARFERFGGKLNLLAINRLSRRLRAYQPDLVATQLSTASLWGSLAARSLGVPCVATVRALNTKTCYLFADRIIVVSHAVKAHLAAQGIPENRMSVVYNGIDLSRFEPLESESALAHAKSALDFPPDAPLIGVVAHLTRKKGQLWFLDAVALLHEKHPSAHFVFVGEGADRKLLEARAETLGISAYVRLAGFHRDIVPWMAALDVMVLPTIEKEGFGRVLVEAGAMCKPVIATPIGGIGEVVADGETGLIVPIHDAPKMAAALDDLLSNPQKRQQMGRAGRERALKHFSVERMVRDTETVYRQLLEQYHA